MKTYEIYMGKNDVIFQPSQTGEWVNLEDITDDDIIALHPTCKWCDHYKDEECAIDPDHTRKVDAESHYCGYHTELL